MPTVEHSTLGAGEIHEPKGVTSASSGQVYIADGANSGNWRETEYYVGGYIGFDKATPAYSHSVTTSDTVLNPTFSLSDSNGFTGLSSPNARLRYDGTPTIDALITFSIAASQASGSNKDIEYVVYVNGSAKEGSRMVRTASTSAWGSTTVQWNADLATNDYVEVFVKGSGACTLLIANAYLSIVGIPRS
jgi:hypothetical protein